MFARLSGNLAAKNWRRPRRPAAPTGLGQRGRAQNPRADGLPEYPRLARARFRHAARRLRPAQTPPAQPERDPLPRRCRGAGCRTRRADLYAHLRRKILEWQLQDRIRWDSIYRERIDNRDFPNPDPLLFQFTLPLRDGETATALDIAAGFGQNGLWLAAQGYTVDLIDVSRVALLHAKAEAAERGLTNANFIQHDLDSASFEPESYDVVCVFRFLSRDLMPQICAAVRPGGRVISARRSTPAIWRPSRRPTPTFCSASASWRASSATGESCTAPRSTRPRASSPSSRPE
ncbi:MAG: class I SAM-dependent methyltransferase [Anaerolineae bacterium]